MIPTLHIHLLGDFLLVSGETPLTSIDMPRMQSLLAYLALHRTALQSRSHLAYLFWPETTDAQAHSNLRTLVHRLRRVLPNADVFLHADRRGLQWQPESPDAPWTLDVLDFEQALVQAEQTTDSTAVRQALTRAVTLYQGDLLPSCYDEWILPERDRLRQAFLRALERLIELLEQAQDYRAAISTAQRLLHHDPLHEATYHHLMRLYATSGDRATALRTYHTCARVLERELALEPSRATRQAYERLLQTEGPTGPLKAPQTSLVAEAPLIGRQQEWAQLQGAWQSTMTGRPHIVVLSGEAGIGKTRLARELLAWAGRQGIATASAHCYATEGGLAYTSVVAWLRTDALRRDLSALAHIWLREVARLLPELLVEHPDLPRPGPLTEGWQRQRLFEALARALLGSGRPLLLLLDDLQWCDHETLEWLSYLLRFDSHARLLIVGTMRLEEVAPDHPVASWLLSLRRDGLVTDSTLGPLDAADTATLAGHVAGKALTSTVAAALHRDTEGNPLFIVESVRAGALEQGGMEGQSEGLVPPPHVLPLPPAVQAVIATRLARLSLHAREVVSLAAVIGRTFTFALLAQASGSDEDVLVRGLDELWQRRIVREQGGDAYDFSHDKLREAAYAALSKARRRLLHRRVFEALQTTATPAAQLAHHALHAGLIEQAFRYSLAAGDDAMHLFAVYEAITHYEQAQHVVTGQAADGHDQHRTLPVVQIHHLYVQLGRAYELKGDYLKAHCVYETMLTFAREEHEPRMECAALNRLATLASWAFDMRTAATLLREALKVAERSGDTVGLAETEWGLAQVSFYTSDAKEALLHAERGLALARERDLKELIARSLNVLAYAYELLGNWEEVTARASEARAFYAALGNRAMEADCLSTLARAQVMSGHPREGIGTARLAHAISVETENAWGQVYSANQLALGLREIGVYTEALSVAQQCVAMARTIGYPLMLIHSFCALGLVQTTMLTPEAARMTLLEAVQLNESIRESSRSRMFSDTLTATLCMCCALAGEWPEAHAYALQAQAVRDYQLLTDTWHFTLWYETEALVRGGDIERAEDAVRRFGACVGEGGGENQRYRLAYLCALAVLTQWRGETDQAIAHLQTAARLSEEISLPGERWQIEAALGALHRARGEERQAGNAFARAAQMVQALADTIENEQLQKMFLSAASVQRVLKEAPNAVESCGHVSGLGGELEDQL